MLKNKSSGGLDARENIDEAGQESFDDIQLAAAYSDVALWGTDWTTETILTQLKRGNIELNPKFQRRDAWSPDRKSRFIESLILGFPIPQVILAERKDKKGAYIVIDGKQRLLAIRQFCAEVEDDVFKNLKLEDLAVLENLNGKDYRLLQDNPEFSSYLTSFQNQSIRTVIIKNWPSDEYLYSVFLRLNTGSLQLSPQELRQALHPGKFIDFAEIISEKPQFQEMLNFSSPDPRMRDVEIVIRYFAFKNLINDYKGKLKYFLDETCRLLNRDWNRWESKLKTQAEELMVAIDVTKSIFGEDAFSVWYRDEFTRRFNRPVFDIMVFYFSNKNIRDSVKSKLKISVKNAFISLCSEDKLFLDSLLTSTKNLDATRRRFSCWGEALAKIIKQKIDLPKI